MGRIRFQRRSIRQILACLCLAAAAGSVSAADLRDLLSAVVMVESEVPANARTVDVLGTERLGSGVVIDGSGLVATTGYLVLEAAQVWVRTGGGQRSRADVIAYDSHSGLGLLRARDELEGVVPMPLGDSASLRADDPVVAASFGGPASLRPLVTTARREFAGYWEYLLENAIFTTPLYRLYGGAALMSPGGELLGIGSLALRDIDGDGTITAGNLFIPVDRLKSALPELLSGARQAGPPRPWLGLYADETAGRIVVQRVAVEGPAEAAGIQTGDVIEAVGSNPVASLGVFYRTLWHGRKPGDEVTLRLVRDGATRSIVVTAADRYDWLRMAR